MFNLLARVYNSSFLYPYPHYYASLAICALIASLSISYDRKYLLILASWKKIDLIINPVIFLLFMSFFFSAFGYASFIEFPDLIYCVSLFFVLSSILLSILTDGLSNFIHRFYHPVEKTLLYRLIAMFVGIVELGLLIVARPVALSARIILNNIIGHITVSIVSDCIHNVILRSMIIALISIIKLSIIGIQCYIFRILLINIYKSLFERSN